MPHQQARSALLFAISGFALLSVGDAIVKSIAPDWPGSAVAALRYAAGAAGLALIVGMSEGRSAFRIPQPWLQFGRGFAVAFATLCFFLALMAMPLADATAIVFTAPILTALLAPLVLKEKTSAATWVATIFAFAGVLVVLRPNLLALGPVAFLPLGAALGMSWLVMLNRKAAGAASPLAMQYYAAVAAAPILVVAAILLAATGHPAFIVPPPPASVIVKCLIVACTATTGHLLIYLGTVRASAALVAPMTYVQLLVAGGLGWAFFGASPDLSTWGGAALIVAGGLWLWRAQRPREVAEIPD